MPKFCNFCGTEIKDNSKFCPECGKKVGVKTQKMPQDKTYEELLKEIIYIKENKDYRLSKAKSVGVILFILIVFGTMLKLGPALISGGFFGLFMVVLSVFIPGIVWYSICRGVGYLIRTYLIK